MKCLVCDHQVPADAWQCPECGDHLGQWIELNTLAAQLLRQGIAAAERGDATKAILCLVESSILKPDVPLTLRVLGEVLLRLGDRQSAAYYLTRCIDLAEATDPDEHEKAKALLAEADRSDVEEGDGLLPRLPAFPIASSQEVSPTGSCASLWQCVTELHGLGGDWPAKLAPILACAQPAEPCAMGPYAYLRGLLAAADGDVDAAQEFFRESAMADASHENADVCLLFLSRGPDEAREVLEFLQANGRDLPALGGAALCAAALLAERREDDKRVTLLEAFLAHTEAAVENPDALGHYMLARVLFALGRLEEAKDHAEKAVALDETCAGALELLEELDAPDGEGAE